MNTSRQPSITAYRSFRYSLNREENVKTANPSSVPKFRIKKNSILQSTMMRTGGFEEHRLSKTISATNNVQANSYIRNFHSLMDSQRKISPTQKLKWNAKPARFTIQNFQQLEHSQFTLLDPFQCHYKSIQITCKSTQKQLSIQTQQIRQIKGQLQNLNKKIIVRMNQMQKSSISQLQKFTALLKQNAIKQQQIKLKFKQEIATLEIQHQEDFRKAQQLLDKNQNLQGSIFDCLPFQLKENQQWTEIEGNQQILGVKSGTLC